MRSHAAAQSHALRPSSSSVLFAVAIAGHGTGTRTFVHGGDVHPAIARATQVPSPFGPGGPTI